MSGASFLPDSRRRGRGEGTTGSSIPSAKPPRPGLGHPAPTTFPVGNVPWAEPPSLAESNLAGFFPQNPGEGGRAAQGSAGLGVLAKLRVPRVTHCRGDARFAAGEVMKATENSPQEGGRCLGQHVWGPGGLGRAWRRLPTKDFGLPGPTPRFCPGQAEPKSGSSQEPAG